MKYSFIIDWLSEYSKNANDKNFVVGVSGGIDSALTSTLCAETGINTYVVSLPIKQGGAELARAEEHIAFLTDKYENVIPLQFELDKVFTEFSSLFEREDELILANSRSRIRMATLYHIAGLTNSLVVGTGNKVEDFGVGFYTKYGDGGVDISPIADLMKSQVWRLGKDLNVLQEIIDAPPTDGLWEDGRTDLDQLGGLTYEQMEHAMTHGSNSEYYDTYQKIRKVNLHKMNPIPVFKNDN